MNRARLYLGITLAAPVTIVTGLLYLLPFWAFGWYRYVGRVATTVPLNSPLGVGWVFALDEGKAPDFLRNLWSGWGGHCVGSTVVLKREPAPGASTLNHELHHVHQMHKLGFLQPILYAASLLVDWAAGESLYHANAFEVAARRASGQIVDLGSFEQGYAIGSKGGKE